MAVPAPAPLKPTGATPSFLINGIACTIAMENLGDRAVVERWPMGEPPSADVVFKCAYQDRYSVVRGLRGGVELNGKKFSYVPPMSYPPSPNLKCTGVGEIVGLRPWADRSGWVQYDHALIPASFTVPTWASGTDPIADPSGLRYTTTKYRGSGEVFAPPDGSYFYTSGTESGKKVANSSVGIIQPRAEISLTRHMIPYAYIDGPLWIIGCVNDDVILYGDREFPRGAILVAAFDAEPNPDPSTGSMAWDYTFTLLANDTREWNAFLDPSGEEVLVNTKADGSGDYPYPYESFDILASDDLQAPPGD